MAEDLLAKGAIMQRDKATHAVAPHIPGGFIYDFNLLRRIDVAKKYRAQVIKITSAERFALIGGAWARLSMKSACPASKKNWACRAE